MIESPSKVIWIVQRQQISAVLFVKARKLLMYDNKC